MALHDPERPACAQAERGVGADVGVLVVGARVVGLAEGDCVGRQHLIAAPPGHRPVAVTPLVHNATSMHLPMVTLPSGEHGGEGAQHTAFVHPR